MTWRVIVVNEHSKLSYQNGSLIYKSNVSIEKIHLTEIHTLLLETTDINITTGLIYKLIESNVKIIFCDAKRHPHAELIPYYGTHDSSKKINQQINWQEDYKQYIWTEVIKQKIHNQAAHLKKIGKIDEANKLFHYVGELQPFDATNREGHSAKVYFNALFGKKFSREQTNDINAFLDYGYSLILSIVNREIAKNGQLTQIGLKHTNYFNPYNLSSDLMEPFRIVIDEIVYEIQTQSFKMNKHRLFEIFQRTYEYGNKKMYLTNVIEHYIKKVLQSLDKKDIKSIPEFRISEL
ncbi:type II CRISPR-associated endonuclease Cas1 [Enterococcus rivorum]|uniref:CRISPR-associated endonuclease Cas1 n=1 Tax=Enterococcus rivorum TaxID=762845 RepID=A0A1E5KVD1_9ENTE|nr:type II CRISPR-associated endonuclease Cas1 [Enterococcus rivorum]MBP2099793.1 CRISPR-associated endonuclease Cas1 subtype II [Enterococcus rivorum]OEH81549.1 subtype II CRISPR-associated endonuclease Cas1 [Enterococcus rivorum]